VSRYRVAQAPLEAERHGIMIVEVHTCTSSLS